MTAIRKLLSAIVLGLCLASCQATPQSEFAGRQAVLTYASIAPAPDEQAHQTAAATRDGGGEICVVAVDDTVFEQIADIVARTRSSESIADVPQPMMGSWLVRGEDGKFEPIYGLIMDTMLFRVEAADGRSLGFNGGPEVRDVDGLIYELPQEVSDEVDRIALRVIYEVGGCPSMQENLEEAYLLGR